MTEMSIGQFVRLKREEARLTQTELAERASVHQSQLSKLERQQGNVSDVAIGRIREALGIDPVEWADRVLGVTNDVERAIAKDTKLSRKEQKALLAAYGQLTGRDSVAKAELVWWKPDAKASDEPPEKPPPSVRLVT